MSRLVGKRVLGLGVDRGAPRWSLVTRREVVRAKAGLVGESTTPFASIDRAG